MLRIMALVCDRDEDTASTATKPVERPSVAVAALSLSGLHSRGLRQCGLTLPLLQPHASQFEVLVMSVCLIPTETPARRLSYPQSILCLHRPKFKMSADTPRSQLEALSLQYTKQQEGAKPPSAPPYQQCRHPAILPASCSDTSQTLSTAQTLCRGKAPLLTKNPYFFLLFTPNDRAPSKRRSTSEARSAIPRKHNRPC